MVAGVMTGMWVVMALGCEMAGDQRGVCIARQENGGGPGAAEVAAATGLEIDGEQVRSYLHSLMPSRQQVTDFIRREQGPAALSRNAGWTFDAELGWVLCDAVRQDGVEGSKTFYNYEPDGARQVVHFADKPCRIHTYGDSFTHCDQVSNGETWQEYLAAHLHEPIRNYGVGGYSVYQVYLRMLRVEKDSPAEYIILNIWDDDHYRNLEAWRSIRFGFRTSCGYTLPYLKVDVERGLCQPVENLFGRSEQVYQLCDEKFVCNMFENDFVLGLVMAARADRQVQSGRAESKQRFGVPGWVTASQTPAGKTIRKMYTEAALFATENVLQQVEAFTRKDNRKLMIVLSFDRHTLIEYLKTGKRFDQGFVDRLADKAYPVVDMRDAFSADYAESRLSPEEYVQQFYVGVHHNPRGNFFTAWAIRQRVAKWLKPAPLPYR